MWPKHPPNWIGSSLIILVKYLECILVPWDLIGLDYKISFEQGPNALASCVGSEHIDLDGFFLNNTGAFTEGMKNGHGNNLPHIAETTEQSNFITTPRQAQPLLHTMMFHKQVNHV